MEDQPSAALVPTCYGWSAPYPFGFDDKDNTRFFIPLKFAPQAAKLAVEVRKHAAGTPLSIPELSAELDAAWEAGAEAIVNYFEQNGMATTEGVGDDEKRSRSWPGPATSERPGART